MLDPLPIRRRELLYRKSEHQTSLSTFPMRRGAYTDMVFNLAVKAIGGSSRRCYLHVPPCCAGKEPSPTDEHEDASGRRPALRLVYSSTAQSEGQFLMPALQEFLIDSLGRATTTSACVLLLYCTPGCFDRADCAVQAQQRCCTRRAGCLKPGNRNETERSSDK